MDELHRTGRPHGADKRHLGHLAKAKARLPPSGAPSGATRSGEDRIQELVSSLKGAYSASGQTMPMQVAGVVAKAEAESGKSVTKNMHAATTARGSARKDLQQIRVARQAHATAWREFISSTAAALEA